MQWEDIGNCGIAHRHAHERMVAELELGAAYVRLICGEPPEGCNLAVMWHESDSIRFATVGLHWDPQRVDVAPGDYIARAKNALTRFDNAVDWIPIDADDIGEEEEVALRSLLAAEQASASTVWERVTVMVGKALSDGETREEANNTVGSLGPEYEEAPDLLVPLLERLKPECALKGILWEDPGFRPNDPLTCVFAAVNMIEHFRLRSRPDTY